MSTIAVLLAQSVPVAPPAPPRPPIVVAPPVIASVAYGRPEQARAERFVVDVEIRAGSETLWSGPMAVSTAGGTSFQRRLTEPAPENCPLTGYGSQVENALTVQLNLQRRADSGAALGVSVRWGRTPAGACPFRSSSRTVELNETVALAPGQGTTLAGDGGLTVRLRRR